MSDAISIFIVNPGFAFMNFSSASTVIRRREPSGASSIVVRVVLNSRSPMSSRYMRPSASPPLTGVEGSCMSSQFFTSSVNDRHRGGGEKKRRLKEEAEESEEGEEHYKRREKVRMMCAMRGKDETK